MNDDRIAGSPSWDDPRGQTMKTPDEFVQAMLIRYDPGAGIGWHRDRPCFEHVVGVSLGASATMRFPRPKARRLRSALGGVSAAVDLPPKWRGSA